MVSLRGPAFRHETQNFARFAFGDDLKRPAADFTIRGETLRRDAGVDDQLKALAAERAVNVRRDFHRTIGLYPILKMGGAGDPPTGTAAGNVAKRPCPLAQTVAPVRSGESLDGAGGSPVLPANHFPNTTRRRRSACEMMVNYFSFSMPSNSTSKTSVAFGPMTGSGTLAP